MSTVIKDGTIVTADRTYKADVLVENGKITKIGEGLSANETLDATGCYVIPGGIDPHTHFEMPFMGQVRCCVAINKSPMFDPHTMQCFPSHASESFETTH